MNLAAPDELATLLEGILLAAGKPLSLERLAELFEDAERPEPKQLQVALQHLATRCAGRAYELKEVATGYRLQIRENLSPWVGRLWEERPQRYSRALLETLALIAYRQPITRGEIEDIRGVAVNSQIVKTLMEREWIRIVGYREVPGRPAMFATTKTFLDYFSLKSLDELPPLVALRALEPQETILEDQPMLAKARLPAQEEDEDYIPPSIQALADQALRDAGEQPLPADKPEEVSFRSLLVELDQMEQGLKTDFQDLLPEALQTIEVVAEVEAAEPRIPPAMPSAPQLSEAELEARALQAAIEEELRTRSEY